MLAEAIFSLFVTILVLSILQNLLFSVKKFNQNSNFHVNELAYAYVQLDNFMHDKKYKTVYPYERNTSTNAAFVCIDKKDQKETYNINFYHKGQGVILKMSKNNGNGNSGYMPLMFKLRDASFKTSKDKIIIHVTEKNKGDSELVFQLDEKPTLKEKSNEKKKNKS